jgi:oxygen-independent coproporphyrinogen-3 oxidase
MIRELILQLKLGHADAAYFQSKFHVTLRERFASQFADLIRSGLGDWDDAIFRLTREALLKVDTLLHPFFLPIHQNARYA